MFTGLNIPYIGKTKLSVKKACIKIFEKFSGAAY